jgi:arylsulfatase A-like enzyme
MTGRYQQRFGHEFNPRYPKRLADGYGLSLNETTIARRLKDAGYATGMFGKWHLGFQNRFNPVSRGFDAFYGFLGGSHGYFPGSNPGQEAEDPRFAIFRGTKPADLTEYTTDAFAREAATFIGRHRAGPFFLYLPFNAVHTPLQAPREYRRRFRDIADPRRRTYAAMASAVDDAVGTVMERIRREGLEGDTLVFFLSDNGGPTSNGSDNRPLRGHKATTWEGGVRVPFLVQWKGRLPAGKVYDRPVAQIDILPTALAAAGAEVDPAWKLDGVNLLPFLQGQDRGEPHEALYWRFGNQTAVRMGNWKLVRGRVGRAPERARDVVVTEPQLFNVAIDVGETRNVAAEQPERVGQLRAAWERWDAELPPPRWRGPDPPRDP